MARLFAVFGGGVLGTSLRWLIDIAIPHSRSDFPLSTLLANVLGCFALAAIIGFGWSRYPEWLKAGLGAGLLGSFTTFSAIMVSTVELGTNGNLVLAVLYPLLSLVLGLGFAFLGFLLGRPKSPVSIDLVDE